MPKYDRCKPEWGLSVFNAVPQTLEQTGLAKEITIFYLDELAQQVGHSVLNELLLKFCAGNKPALAIFIPTDWPDLDPSRVIMNIISNKLQIKVYLARGDPGGLAGHQISQSWFPFINFMGFIDTTVSSLGYTQNPKAIQAFSHRNKKDFCDKKLERDIDVSFVGSIGNWQHRAEYIQFLWEHGVSVVTGGGLEYDTRLSIDEYSDLINRSKISLNFCLHRTEAFSQIKGRVFEILLCKSCLFEDAGTETAKFLEVNKDFVMYHTKKELLEKVLYYLKHDEEREKIAESGYSKATTLYTAKNLWGYTLEKMGFALPGDFAQSKNYQTLYKKMDLIREGL